MHPLNPHPEPNPTMAKPTATSVKRRSYGFLPNGDEVDAWSLVGAGGLELEVITYGGIVTRLMAPDHGGVVKDVVLGFDTLDGYLNPENHMMGATTGRVAGRITRGELLIHGRLHQLPLNEPPNHLHGGTDALHSKVWSATVVERDDGAPSLKLRYRSCDGESGHPGNVDLAVIYTVSADNEFVYETHAHSDQDCPISLAHHSYFNLAGEDHGSILDHLLQVASDETIPFTDNFTLLDRRESVADSGSDLRCARKIGDYIVGTMRQHGDLYWLGDDLKLRRVARLVDEASRRCLSVSTTHGCLQLYSGAFMPAGLIGKSGRNYQPYSGFCLETGEYPNACKLKGFGNILVAPGKPQHHVTVYAFSTV
ncbi:MAG: aldose epimerase family protein [Verrucomicrobiota bacterium]